MSEITSGQLPPTCSWPDCRNICGCEQGRPVECRANQALMSEVVLHEFGPQRRFGFVLRWVLESTRATATAYRIDAVGDNGTWYLPHKQQTNQTPDTTDVEQAEVFLEMSVKWDGCINTTIQPEFHFCEAEDLRQLGELFKYIYTKATVLLGDRLYEYTDLWCNESPTFLPPSPFHQPQQP
jgi:hypothetical protein